MNNKLLILISIPFILLNVSCNKSIPFDSSLFIKGDEVISFNDYKEDSKVMYVSNHYGNGGMFRSIWSDNRFRYENGIGYLSIVDKENINYGAEIRTKHGYLYGYFGARIKTFKHNGTVQSLFTYNGGPNYRWDEIDIEFLGKDTTKVQFNYYQNGIGGHEYLYDLGFDSSTSFHDYGFKWEENKITWYIDFKPVYATYANLIQWGNFFINVWAGNDKVNQWLNKYESTTTPLECAYDYMCYSPLD